MVLSESGQQATHQPMEGPAEDLPQRRLVHQPSGAEAVLSWELGAERLLRWASKRVGHGWKHDVVQRTIVRVLERMRRGHAVQNQERYLAAALRREICNFKRGERRYSRRLDPNADVEVCWERKTSDPDAEERRMRLLALVETGGARLTDREKCLVQSFLTSGAGSVRSTAALMGCERHHIRRMLRSVAAKLRIVGDF